MMPMPLLPGGVAMAAMVAREISKTDKCYIVRNAVSEFGLTGWIKILRLGSRKASVFLKLIGAAPEGGDRGRRPQIRL